MTLAIPAIGEWYRAPGGLTFEVVAVDDEDGTIDIQHYDGTVEELDFDAWEESEFVATDPPEDYAGSLDIEREDYGLELDQGIGRDWSDPLEFLDQAD